MTKHTESALCEVFKCLNPLNVQSARSEENFICSFSVMDSKISRGAGHK